jgi:hypothetical protein
MVSYLFSVINKVSSNFICSSLYFKLIASSLTMLWEAILCFKYYLAISQSVNLLFWLNPLVSLEDITKICISIFLIPSKLVDEIIKPIDLKYTFFIHVAVYFPYQELITFITWLKSLRIMHVGISLDLLLIMNMLLTIYWVLKIK